MPHTGSFGLVLSLHVLSAVFVVGPLGLATVTAPWLLRAGRDALPALRGAVRATRGYSLASVVVAGLGFVILHEGSFGSVRKISDGWILWSIVLWACAVVLGLTVVARGLAAAVEEIEAGRDGRRHLPAVAVGGLATTLCWVTIVVLMVVKPGA
jgi:hypothetical protein